MQIQVHTNHSVSRHEATAEHIARVLERDLQHHAGQITRVEVHLGDEASHKSTGADLRCMMEARVANHPPVAVTHHAGDMHLAIEGAADKLKRAVDSALARRNAARHAAPEVGTDEA